MRARLTNAQIEAALDHYSDPAYPIAEQFFCHSDPKTGKQTPIPFSELVEECRERKWWAEQSIRLLHAIVLGFDGKGDPFAPIEAARKMLRMEKPQRGRT